MTKSVLYLRENKELDVHILSDQSSLEIFTQDYRNNHALNVFASDAQNGIFFHAFGGSVAIKHVNSCGLERTIR